MTDAAIVQQLAGARPIVELAHPRLRPAGAIGVVWRDGHAIAISAHRCALASVPEALAELTQLARLDLGDNQLRQLPELPASLRELYVHDNQLAALPALPALRVLDANRNQLAALPPLADLDFVYLAANRLTGVPACSNVRYLNVGQNPLTRLAITDAAIRELRAEHAELVDLELGRLPALRELALRGNRLAQLPALALPDLGALDLRGNQLDELPDLRHLPLTKLDLRWNPLRRPPRWLDELRARGCMVYT